MMHQHWVGGMPHLVDMLHLVGGMATLQPLKVDRPPLLQQGTLHSEGDRHDLHHEMEASLEVLIEGVASLQRVEDKVGMLLRMGQDQGKEEGDLLLD